jgi:hypothetical protein
MKPINYNHGSNHQFIIFEGLYNTKLLLVEQQLYHWLQKGVFATLSGVIIIKQCLLKRCHCLLCA